MEINTAKLNTILIIVTIIGGTFSIIQNYKSVKEALGFKEKPSWEGHWKMKIGSSNIGETETLLRIENGKLIGSYSLYGESKSVFSTQMIGYVTEDNNYKGEWFQFSDSTFQISGKFNLILKDDKTFQGTFCKMKKNGGFGADSKWLGEKIQ